jgi:hypothetical protein
MKSESVLTIILILGLFIATLKKKSGSSFLIQCI